MPKLKKHINIPTSCHTLCGIPLGKVSRRDGEGGLIDIIELDTPSVCIKCRNKATKLISRHAQEIIKQVALERLLQYIPQLLK